MRFRRADSLLSSGKKADSLGMCRWPLRAPTPLQSFLWPIIDPVFVTFGQICNFRDPNSVTFYLCIYLSCPIFLIERRTLYLSPTSSPGRFSLALQSQGKAPWGRGWDVYVIEVPLQTLDEILGGSFPTTKHSGGRYQ